MADNQPPPYASVLAADPTSPLRTSRPPHFYLDGTLIFPSSPPARASYELSGPPCEAKSASYEVRKIVYKVTTGRAVRHREERIYRFRPFRMPSCLTAGRRHVLVDGLGARQVDQVEMVPAWHGDASWTVGGYFRVTQARKDRFRRRRSVTWLDGGGRPVAVEERVRRDVHGRVVGLPDLELLVNDMDDRMVDLLVACWSARLWKESLNAIYG
jgi:hypothetical protein